MYAVGDVCDWSVIIQREELPSVLKIFGAWLSTPTIDTKAHPVVKLPWSLTLVRISVRLVEPKWFKRNKNSDKFKLPENVFVSGLVV